MITGVVTLDRTAVIRLAVRGPEGQGQGLETIIDTGLMGLSPSRCLSLQSWG